MKIEKLIPIIIVAITLSVYTFLLTKQQVLNGNQKYIGFRVNTFTSMLVSFDEYKKAVYKPWRSRLFSTGTAALSMKAMGFKRTINRDSFGNMLGSWQAAWFFAVLMIFVFKAKNKLLMLFGTFSGTVYQYLINDRNALPWDGPELFIWTFALYAYLERWKVFQYIVAAGIGFKESLVVLAILPLFKRNGHREFILTISMCVFVKVVLDIIAGNQLLFTAICRQKDSVTNYGMISMFADNFRDIFSLKINHVIFSAAGLIIPFFIMRVRRDFKVLVVVYLAFIMIHGVIYEVRLFHPLLSTFLVWLDSKEVQV